MPDFTAAEETALALLDGLMDAAAKQGAEAADAVLFESTSVEASCRLGKPEDLQRSESRDIGLRVLIGKKQSFVSTGDTTPAALAELVERAVAMAKVAPEDPYCGLADVDRLAGDIPELDLAEQSEEPEAEMLIERALAAEAAATGVPGVTNSEGAEAGWGSGVIALRTSTGFRNAYSSTNVGLGVSVVAGEGTAMERDYEFTSARHDEDLDDPATVGRAAGERAVKRLNPRKVPSGPVPVVFDPRVANSLLGHFAGAINGAAVARGTSFLKDRMGETVFAERIMIVDDPHRIRGQRSKPFDGEGVANGRCELVSNGTLNQWLLDSASARQLGLQTTGHAARGTASPPSPATTNLYMAAGAVSRDDLIGAIDKGFYVTELIGFGVNGVTGDYSRGAAGFWIENGEIAFPVSELTIAGNLKDMFKAITAAADLVFKYGTNAPTLRVDGMTVAGA
jgi:PmbA protein